MKRHQLAPTKENAGTRREHGVTPCVVTHRRRFVAETTHAPRVSSEISFVPTKPRAHTLVLTGDLDRSSVTMLESEIERLCEEGVTDLTLDLRALKWIDSTGATVVAFRRRLCEQRGCHLAVIPGAAGVRSALEQAGLECSTMRSGA
jgi:anti-anti-sigma factor